jgi:ketosteroid isomerase-like protein
LIGRQAIPASDTAMARAEAESRKRSHEHFKTRVQKVAVSTSGDMAYGFALFDLEFDRPDSTGKREHVKFEGSQLTVWRKQAGQWLLAAAFARPNE